MPRDPVEVLRRWARGDFYPLSRDEPGRNALDELAEHMRREPIAWWRPFHDLLLELDEEGVRNLDMPLAALLNVGSEPLVDEVASSARGERKVANAFWIAMHLLQRSSEAYQRLGRRQTIEAFVRYVPRIPSSIDQPREETREDEWSGEAIAYLNKEDPDEAWAVALELLRVSADPGWIGTVGAFIVEDLLRDYGDVLIERIEAEAATNDRLRRSLPTTLLALPEHLMARVKAAAGQNWDDRPESR